MASKAARAAAAVAAGAGAGAGRRVASDIRRIAPARSPWRGFFGGDTAAGKLPLLSLAASGPRILRRGLVMIPRDPSPGPEEFTPDMFDPYAGNLLNQFDLAHAGCKLSPLFCTKNKSCNRS
ncbi:unnamed protein product [Urochloa humidicola]